MAGKLSLYYEDDPATIETVLSLVEQAHPDKKLHDWILGEDRGQWVADNCLFYTAFREDPRGYVAILQCEEDKHWIHFGNLKANCLRDVRDGFEIIKSKLINRGVEHLYFESDEPIINKLANLLGFINGRHKLCITNQ